MGTKPAGLSNEAIQEYAELVGEHYKVYSEEGLADVSDLLAKLGGVCDYARNNESLHIRERGDFTIYTPPFSSDRRDRFTKAHELGHYFLHFLYQGGKGEDIHFHRGGGGRAETEANIFASALLMPSVIFTKAFEELEGNIVNLARRFDVSPAAAQVRADVLGLVI